MINILADNKLIFLIIRILVEIITFLYILYRFQKYFVASSNNNITSDAFIRWEHVSIIDKYHLRERLLRGSRLRIKRDPKRYEIKYIYYLFIPIILLFLFSIKNEDNIIIIISLILLLISIKSILDRMEKRRPFFIIIDLLAFIIFVLIWAYYSNFTLKGYDYSDPYNQWLYIPVMILTLVLMYSVFRKRLVSMVLCASILIGACTLRSISGKIIMEYYLPVFVLGYMYISLIVLQRIYNTKALKKISFIK